MKHENGRAFEEQVANLQAKINATKSPPPGLLVKIYMVILEKQLNKTGSKKKFREGINQPQKVKLLTDEERINVISEFTDWTKNHPDYQESANLLKKLTPED